MLFRSDERIRSLLCSAFEGGFAASWALIEDYKFPEGITLEDFQEGGRLTTTEYHPSYLLIPFHPGCSIIISDETEAGEEDAKRGELNIETMKKGLQLMATKYPHHFADFVKENDDAITGDVFLQLCLFDDIIYG